MVDGSIANTLYSKGASLISKSRSFESALKMSQRTWSKSARPFSGWIFVVVPSGHGKTTCRVVFEHLMHACCNYSPLIRPLIDIDELLCYEDYPRRETPPDMFMPPCGAWKPKDHGVISRLVDLSLRTNDWDPVNKWWKGKLVDLRGWWDEFKRSHPCQMMSPVVLIHSPNQIPVEWGSDYLLFNCKGCIMPEDGIAYWKSGCHFEVRYPSGEKEIREPHRLAGSSGQTPDLCGATVPIDTWSDLFCLVQHLCLFPFEQGEMPWEIKAGPGFNRHVCVENAIVMMSESDALAYEMYLDEKYEKRELYQRILETTERDDKITKDLVSQIVDKKTSGATAV